MGAVSILIADDDDLILKLLTLGFEKFGIKVFTTYNGSDAWDLFKSEHIDLVLTDIRMPGFNGKELSRMIRNESPSTKIALMSGDESDGIAELLNNGTANYFFLKPFDITYICNILLAEVPIS
jgi:DNA-binding response OmpR family regulator